MAWVKKTQKEIKERIFDSLKQNVNYQNESIIGLPGSYLDEKVFSQDKFNLLEAPFLFSLLSNPNHIGCHTIGESESFFSGTQAIEKDVISICAQSILKGGEDEFDGYVASGGTEANMQAIWVYRNFFIKEKEANLDEITILCSSDSHYSMAKASNVLNISIYKTQVDFETRKLVHEDVERTIEKAKQEGKKYFIVVANMMTTMFGSVDNLIYTDVLKEKGIDFKLHIDGAYGGFYYPFIHEGENYLNFSNPDVSSVTLDAHKMAQAPYGTGIFLVRKNLIHYATTKEASYVEGEDCTLIGSRSGANAIAIWMILSTYGPNGWMEKMYILQKRAEYLAKELNNLNVEFYKHPSSNIITIKSSFLSQEITQRFGLVPDNHHDPRWFKIVVMEHVTLEKINLFLTSLKKTLTLI
jgi:glutamate/tyrosine decarboxylase-like PLP-dependent enzyme